MLPHIGSQYPQTAMRLNIQRRQCSINAAAARISRKGATAAADWYRRACLHIQHTGQHSATDLDVSSLTGTDETFRTLKKPHADVDYGFPWVCLTGTLVLLQARTITAFVAVWNRLNYQAAASTECSNLGPSSGSRLLTVTCLRHRASHWGCVFNGVPRFGLSPTARQFAFPAFKTSIQL